MGTFLRAGTPAKRGDRRWRGRIFPEAGGRKNRKHQYMGCLWKLIRFGVTGLSMRLPTAGRGERDQFASRRRRGPEIAASASSPTLGGAGMTARKPATLPSSSSPVPTMTRPSSLRSLTSRKLRHGETCRTHERSYRGVARPQTNLRCTTGAVADRVATPPRPPTLQTCANLHEIPILRSGNAR